MQQDENIEARNQPLYTEKEYNDAIKEARKDGYDEGYDEGYTDGLSEHEE